MEERTMEERTMEEGNEDLYKYNTQPAKKVPWCHGVTKKAHIGIVAILCHRYTIYSVCVYYLYCFNIYTPKNGDTVTPPQKKRPCSMLQRCFLWCHRFFLGDTAPDAKNTFTICKRCFWGVTTFVLVTPLVTPNGEKVSPLLKRCHHFLFR